MYLFFVHSNSHIIYSDIFHNVIGFGTKAFIPHTAWSLLSKLLFKHFVNRYNFKDAIRILLTEESSLGTHTDVFVYYARSESSISLFHYAWAHISSRPFTVNKPWQCPKCGCMPGSLLHDARKSRDGNSVIIQFKCQVNPCNWTHTESKSANIKDMKDALSISTRVGNKRWAADNGQWCFEKLAIL